MKTLIAGLVLIVGLLFTSPLATAEAGHAGPTVEKTHVGGCEIDGCGEETYGKKCWSCGKQFCPFHAGAQAYCNKCR